LQSLPILPKYDRSQVFVQLLVDDFVVSSPVLKVAVQMFSGSFGETVHRPDLFDNQLSGRNSFDIFG
jgi:hypothetical protein